MKTTLATLLVGVGMFAMGCAPASAWYCQARGTTGASGWGSSASAVSARNIALRECAVRTPRNARCYIMYCRR